MADYVVYRNPDEPRRNSWVRLLLYRIFKKNQNNLIAVVGATGTGKSYSAISICEMMAAKTKIPFTIDHIVFNLKDLMALINSGKLKKGSCIIYDEPQVTISAREFQSISNRVFNYLITTFRHMNLTLFFCAPFEDLLDKTARKLFHAKFKTMSIDIKNKQCRLKPLLLEYNSDMGKFYKHRLVVFYKCKDSSQYRKNTIDWWDVPIPSKEISVPYEAKKKAFTDKLNLGIADKLQALEEKDKPVKPIERKPLTKREQLYISLHKEHDGNMPKIAKGMDVCISMAYQYDKAVKKKGWLSYKVDSLGNQLKND